MSRARRRICFRTAAWRTCIRAALTRTAPNGWVCGLGPGRQRSCTRTRSRTDGAASWNIKQGDGAFTAAGFQRVSDHAARGCVSLLRRGCTPAMTANIRASSRNTYRRSIRRRARRSAWGSIRPAELIRTRRVWCGSASAAPYDQRATPSAVAEAQGDTVTVFSRDTGAGPANNVYWDAAQFVNTDELVRRAAQAAPGHAG